MTVRRVGREYPAAPIVGVAGVVIRGDEVLMIRRGREPMLGRWSLPGGALELGETMAEGVAREVYEETGLRVVPIEMVATLDRIVRDDAGEVRFHYLLVDWLCRLAGAERGIPVPGDDAQDAAWIRRSELGLGDGAGDEAPSARIGDIEAVMLCVVGDAFRRAEAHGL